MTVALLFGTKRTIERVVALGRPGLTQDVCERPSLTATFDRSF